MRSPLGIGRLVPRQAALALDALQHRRLLAADIGAGAAPELDFQAAGKAGLGQLCKLVGEELADRGILVAKVDVDLLRLDRPSGDQHAFQHAVRVSLQEIAVLEGPGLAFIGVDRHQPRARLLTHQSPFLAGGEAGAAKPAQPGAFHTGDDLIGLTRARSASFKEAIAAVIPIGLQAAMGDGRRLGRAGSQGGADAGRVRGRQQTAADMGRRRLVAGADARSRQHPHASSCRGSNLVQQALGTGERAAQRVADAHRHLGRRRRAVFRHIEVVIEGRDLVHLRHRQAQLMGEGGEQPGRQGPAGVLDQMQILDQMVAAPLSRSEQRPDFGERPAIDLAALRLRPRLAAAAAGVARLGSRGFNIWHSALLHRPSGFFRLPRNDRTTLTGARVFRGRYCRRRPRPGSPRRC